MKENSQLVCINIDDSGKLVDNELVSIYAGVVFTSKLEKDKFITQYRSIINNIRCKYCQKNDNTCNNYINCPELKHSNLKPKHLRQLMNYIKKYSTVGCIINNEKIYSSIKSNSASRGRFLDYALKLLIKETLLGLINNKIINPYKPVKLILNIDEQTTKSNGYYNLKESILEELKFGIYNFNYAISYVPILKNDLDIKLNYQKSNKSYLIQASDLIAGTIRRLYLNNISCLNNFYNNINFINYKIILP